MVGTVGADAGPDVLFRSIARTSEGTGCWRRGFGSLPTTTVAGSGRAQVLTITSVAPAAMRPAQMQVLDVFRSGRALMSAAVVRCEGRHGSRV